MKKRSFDPGRIDEELGALRGEANSVHEASLENVKRLQGALGALIQHEAQRLRGKLRSEHPRVQRLEEHKADYRALTKAFAGALEVARINVPDREEGEALIHGRIKDAEERGLTHLVVQLEDKAGRRIMQIGRAETGASGYYSFVVDREVIRKVGGKDVFVSVRTREGKQLRRSEQPVRLRSGEHPPVEMTVDRGSILRPSGQAASAGGGAAAARSKARGAPGLEAIKGVGPKRAEKLRQAGIRNARDFAEADEGKLEEVLNYEVDEIKRENADLLRRARRAGEKGKERR